MRDRIVDLVRVRVRVRARVRTRARVSGRRGGALLLGRRALLIYTAGERVEARLE